MSTAVFPLSSERPGVNADPEAAAVALAIGDLTLEQSDAIVNPAGGGLVDLAVQRAAGPALLDAFRDRVRRLPGARLTPGKVVVTNGFALHAKHVIHCGLPTYAHDPQTARRELAECHLEALRVARVLGARSISFPAIATGAYRFPIPEAAEIATRVAIDELRRDATPKLVRFVLHGPATLDLYLDAARRHLSRNTAR